jgi:hypothetical protein
MAGATITRMLDRLSLYDILAAIVPGALFVCAVAVLFPEVTHAFGATTLPDEFAVVALLAASMLAGLAVQTIGSALERPLFWVFRGRPSDRALNGTLGERYLPRDAAARIEGKLRSRFGERTSKRALFLCAMNLAESTSDSKAATFNAQYGHLRAVFTLFLVALGLGVASRTWGAAAEWSVGFYRTSVGVSTALAVLFAWRAWQRGAYYAREVLLTSERLLSSRSSTEEPRP